MKTSLLFQATFALKNCLPSLVLHAYMHIDAFSQIIQMLVLYLDEHTARHEQLSLAR